MIGIDKAKPGVRLGDIGAAIQAHAEQYRPTAWCATSAATASAACSTTPPKWSTPPAPAPAPSCVPACSSTIEPMINLGKAPVKLLSDGWTAVTRDKSLSAQFEHSIGITEDGAEIFTLSPEGLDKPPYA